MVFSSLLFLFYFLPAVLAVYFIVPRRAKNVVLLLFSLFFYAWGEPVYIFLMLFSICMDYLLGLWMERAKQAPGRAKKVLALAVVLNVALLGFFKYADFFVENLNALTGLAIPALQIPLPIGISFYTFQAMSYLIDLYRGDVPVQRNIISFGTYVSLFPQLIAGPIVRMRTVVGELADRRENFDDFSSGVKRFVTGLGKKVLIANTVGADIPFCDPTQAYFEQADREPLFFRTDHHWTVYGAFAAYQAWARSVGLTPLQMEDYTAKTVSADFLGTLYSKANLPWIQPEKLEIFEPKQKNPCQVTAENGKIKLNSLYDSSFLEGRDKYSYFLGGNHPVTEVTTSVKNGRNLLILKDSYAHSFVPFLTAHFETITLVDPRYFKEDLFAWMEGKGFTDILVIYNAATFAEDAILANVLAVG